jgi:endoglucanase
MLKTQGNKILDDTGKEIRLRGICVGGWMNMENFINGFPGDEHGVRSVAAEILGASRAKFLFDRWLDYFLANEDIAHLKALGANVVRLPINYRHFENDSKPFHYLEEGFRRLSRAVDSCARHGVYAIIDLHAAQGWQNTDWHCDNSSRQTLLWQHPHFQERVISLWKEIARRYRGNATVAGYNLLNEPVMGAPGGRYPNRYAPDWNALNDLYRRLVQAIRKEDHNHICFLEGDYFSVLFSHMDPPFAPNLVYSNHYYPAASIRPGKYPGKVVGELWNKQRLETEFLGSEGYAYTQKYSVPLWVGEFGGHFSGPASDRAYRLSALTDLLDIFEKAGSHWTIWTYKDIGVMGLMKADPHSEYMQLIRSALRMKDKLQTDSWLAIGVKNNSASDLINRLATVAERTTQEPDMDHAQNRTYLGQSTLGGYFANLMQPTFVRCFKGLSEEQIDRVMQSFAFSACQPNKPLASLLSTHWKA